ncbi:unnamed protein product [Candida verbasci]|uniref:Small ribosomal subunit protein uS9m n=1 Tax=Candida verbasci TaxID=1227364 RepID=A0A9W4TUC0_9ASCO|nr:unnamed protein product [Candida verbasci]
MMASGFIRKQLGVILPRRTFYQSFIKFNSIPESQLQAQPQQTKPRLIFDEQTRSPRTNRKPKQNPFQITENLTLPELKKTRIVPELETFYGGSPIHESNLNKVTQLYQRFKHLPTRILTPQEIESNKFITFEEYKKRTLSGTRVRSVQFKELIDMLARLRNIEFELLPKEVIDVLNEFKDPNISKNSQLKNFKTLDSFGRAKAIAKRKNSRAIVHLVKGDGKILVNGINAIEYFPNVYNRQSLTYPFKVVDQENQYNIFVKVSGGGMTGQSEAAMYAVAKALVIFNPLLKSRLRKAGLMTVDRRRAERKKPGKMKARKSPTWVKR